MNWLNRYRLQLYVRNSIWIWPAIAIVLAVITARLLINLDASMRWQLRISADTGRIILSTIAASTFTLVVLVSSAVLVAVQLASAQLTPRIIALVYRNGYRKFALALFVYTFTFSLTVLVRMQDTVPLLTGYFAAYSFLLNLALFILFIDGMGKTLRPSAAMRVIALAGRDVIREVYPSPLKDDSVFSKPVTPVGVKSRIVHNTEDGAVLAFDKNGLMLLAQQADCLIELVPEVGDFIAAGDPLFRISNGGAELSDSRLQDAVAIGFERTLEQDPLFAFRIIVDIASKALSPAINDPTTAVLAIDHIHHLLRDVGKRYLNEGQEADACGQVRLIYRTPNWEDFLLLASTEIRQYGRDSIQVQRRLRAMLEDLIQTLATRRHSSLIAELALLTSSSKRNFPDLHDQALADSCDLQGIGGSYDTIYQHDHLALRASGN